MKDNILNPLHGMFPYRGRYWYRNLANIPRAVRAYTFFLKHGYPQQAQWETAEWLRSLLIEVLTYYRYHRQGSPWVIGEGTDEDNIKAYNKILANMLWDLYGMGDDYWAENDIWAALGSLGAGSIDFETKERLKNDRKNDFFKIFSEHFYDLWD